MPDSTSVSYNTWEVENSIVMAWLINLMEPNIGGLYLFYNTAKEIWDVVQEMYSDFENVAQSIEIRSTIRNTRQGLNTDLGEVHGCIPGKKPLPNLKEVFYEVRLEESRKKVMLALPKIISPDVVSQGPALVINCREGTNQHVQCHKDKQLRCDHCKPYHNKDTCWDIHYKPPDWKPRNQQKNNGTAYSGTDGHA
ncbi:hypothetical protein BUALT_Bualt15G0100100 [Buddleja alternifolia]|uniref:Retrotransposon gag domain-containing protein n=1 Tax=Buddleja alternifolia TaxID=168488 RepID=A0AAV6WPN4_9LAMI|nr:hypothetical protein BUALT_Bualt15G0100100 [Buddleja alternifolia]